MMCFMDECSCAEVELFCVTRVNVCVCSRLGQYVVPAGQRWLCVFHECWSRLGCDAAGKGERAVAWENIAVTVTTARRYR